MKEKKELSIFESLEQERLLLIELTKNRSKTKALTLLKKMCNSSLKMEETPEKYIEIIPLQEESILILIKSISNTYL